MERVRVVGHFITYDTIGVIWRSASVPFTPVDYKRMNRGLFIGPVKALYNKKQISINKVKSEKWMRYLNWHDNVERKQIVKNNTRSDHK